MPLLYTMLVIMAILGLGGEIARGWQAYRRHARMVRVGRPRA